MEILIRSLTYSHIAAGVVSLVAAPVAMAVAKGKDAHRIFGKVFFWCMSWIFVSATILSVYKSNLFLLLVGVFSYYSVVSGYRALYHKRLLLGEKVKPIDWLAAAVAAGFNVYFVFNGIRLVAAGNTTLGALSLLFGGIGLLTVAGNLRSFLSPSSDRHAWLYRHISGFLAGFIASLTAFSTQVLTFLPDFLTWAWPTIVGSPLIAFWIRSYRSKLKNGARLSELVEIRR